MATFFYQFGTLPQQKSETGGSALLWFPLCVHISTGIVTQCQLNCGTLQMKAQT